MVWEKFIFQTVLIIKVLSLMDLSMGKEGLSSKEAASMKVKLDIMLPKEKVC
jgi:hypothetical protein